MAVAFFLSVLTDGWIYICNVKNENVRTYSPSMARCCPPLAAAHPRVSSLSFYPPFRKHSQTRSHSLSICSHFPNLSLASSLSCSRSLSLHLDVVSVYQDRLEVAAAIFRWQHPPSPSLPPSTPSLSLAPSLSPNHSLAYSLSHSALCQHIRTNHWQHRGFRWAIWFVSGSGWSEMIWSVADVYAVTWVVNKKLDKPSMTSGSSFDYYGPNKFYRANLKHRQFKSRVCSLSLHLCWYLCF